MWYIIAIFGILWLGESINKGLIAVGLSIQQGLAAIAKAMKKQQGGITMELKRVSFSVAKALKEAGYPQEGVWYYSPDGRIGEAVPDPEDYLAPTYLQAWLWLWREKKYRILLSASNQRWDEVHGIVTGTDGEVCQSYHRGEKAYDATDHRANWQDPEEAITEAINHLVEHKLLK